MPPATTAILHLASDTLQDRTLPGHVVLIFASKKKLELPNLILLLKVDAVHRDELKGQDVNHVVVVPVLSALHSLVVPSLPKVSGIIASVGLATF